MIDPGPLPDYLGRVVASLRRRGMDLGVPDVDAVRQALRAGFGLRSTEDLVRVCVRLWAKSADEARLVEAAFARVGAPRWRIELRAAGVPTEPSDATPEGMRTSGAAHHADLLAAETSEGSDADDAGTQDEDADEDPQFTVRAVGPEPLAVLPPVLDVEDATLVLTPQYPVTDRDVTQIWRRLRRPSRSGPPTELDVDGTVAERGRTGIATAPILRPARRNTVDLIQIVDRGGSMTPHHPFVEHVSRGIGRVGTVLYIHNTFGAVANRTALEGLADSFARTLDPVLHAVEATDRPVAFLDPDLTEPADVDAMLAGTRPGRCFAVFSDAGAGRGHFDMLRLLDTVAMLRLLAAAGPVAWLNPLPPECWARSTAAQIARHVPMLPLNRAGLAVAVDIMRGHPSPVESPL
ncbi:hypothetical protein AB0J72_41160 [Dactylosporangium sp. NPDC049742]|uniref:hypothetical protein n=1 Tax=Dactylosporangium sp. NPDC049742 TaxID=3154737 RepID=UPI0034437A23